MNEIFSGAKFCTEIGGREVEVSGADIRNALRYYHEHEESLTEGKWIKVVPEWICEGLFSTPRESREEEQLRRKIVVALAEAKKNEKYKKTFYFLVPKEPENKTFNQILADAKKENLAIMDWVWQGLEWAFRITQGESWENICLNPDTSSWFRVIKSKESTYEVWGGARRLSAHIPETTCLSTIRNYEYTYKQEVPVYVHVEK